MKLLVSWERGATHMYSKIYRRCKKICNGIKKTNKVKIG